MKTKIWLSSPHMGDREFEYVKDAFDTNWIAPLGPHVNNFEKELSEYTNVSHTAALTSGTGALHLALILLGTKTGDEVICQSFTFSASANPIVYQGATPIFIDSEKDTWNMDPLLLEDTIKDRIRKGKKPKAIIIVHLYGMPAKMEQILDISIKYQVPIIEDAAEALGSRYRIQNSEFRIKNEEENKKAKVQISKSKEVISKIKDKDLNSTLTILPGGRQVHNSEFRMCGSFGELSILSFNGNKIITTSGGGALLSNNKEYIDKARFLATQARDDAPHYQHSHIGYNYRLSNVLAAIGRGQLTVLEERVKQRRYNYEFYKKSLSEFEGIVFQPEMEGSFSNRWLTAITVNPKMTDGVTREDIRLALEKENIESRPLWKPMHMQPIFKDAPSYLNGTSEKLFDEGLCLPSGSNLLDDDLVRVVSAIKRVLKG